MKHSFILSMIFIGLLIGSHHAFAQGVGGGGSGGGGLGAKVTNVNATPGGKGCPDGRKELFWEQDRLGERLEVWRVCQNGSYYDRNDYIYDPKSKCRNGRLATWSLYNKLNGEREDGKVVCRNNKWYAVEDYYEL